MFAVDHTAFIERACLTVGIYAECRTSWQDTWDLLIYTDFVQVSVVVVANAMCVCHVVDKLLLENLFVDQYGFIVDV